VHSKTPDESVQATDHASIVKSDTNIHPSLLQPMG